MYIGGNSLRDLCGGVDVVSNQNNGGPAFPTDSERQNGANSYHYEGMTLRQYAAIKLRVPESGDEWLDGMIRKCLRDELAAKAAQGLLASDAAGAWGNFAESAYKMADAMLKERDR